MFAEFISIAIIDRGGSAAEKKLIKPLALYLLGKHGALVFGQKLLSLLSRLKSDAS